MKEMNCIIKKEVGRGGLVHTMKEVPEIFDNEVLIKILATAICGTDIHIKEWNEWSDKRVKPPIIIGHEFVGEVIEIGKNVTSIEIGNIVSAESHIACGYCEMCKNGNKHVCYNTKLLGVNVDGSFAEFIKIPEEIAFVCDSTYPIEVLSLMEPLGVAVHAVMEFPLASKTVAIVGCGPIGLMAIALTKKMGASKIIAVEPNIKRGKIATDMGADYYLNPVEVDLVERIRKISGDNGVDVVLEFSGNVKALEKAIEYTKSEGKIAAVGLSAERLSVDFAEFVYRGLTIKGIAGRLMYESWTQIKGFLENGLDISKVITHVLPLSKFEEGIELMEKGECGKVILKP